jgi:hypothetical protein
MSTPEPRGPPPEEGGRNPGKCIGRRQADEFGGDDVPEHEEQELGRPFHESTRPGDGIPIGEFYHRGRELGTGKKRDLRWD